MADKHENENLETDSVVVEEAEDDNVENDTVTVAEEDDDEIEESKSKDCDDDEDGPDFASDDDDDEDEDEKSEAKEEAEVKEALSKLFDGEKLSEGFKSKALRLFEMAIEDRVADRMEAKQAEFEAMLEDRVAESTSQVAEEIQKNVDSYLNYVVESWYKENEIAVESAIKVDMAESLMESLARVFEEHNIDVSEEKVDVVARLEEELEEAVQRSVDLMTENAELKEGVDSIKREIAVDELSEGLTATQTARFEVLTEKLSSESLEDFVRDAAEIKKTFFSESASYGPDKEKPSASHSARRRDLQEEGEVVEVKEEIEDEKPKNAINDLANYITMRKLA